MSKKLREITLLEGVTDTDTGHWVDVAALERMSIQVKGITSATVQIRGSCAPSKPDDSSDEAQVDDDITADKIITTTGKLKWIKAKVSSYTSGEIYVYLIGDSRAYGL